MQTVGPLGGPTISKLITRLRDEYISFKIAQLQISEQVRGRALHPNPAIARNATMHL